MLSVGLSAGVLAAMAKSSGLSSPLAWVLMAAGSVLQIWVLVIGPSAMLAAVYSLPLPIRVALTLTWPALASVLLACWKSDQTNIEPLPRTLAGDSLCGALKYQYRRLTVLNWPANGWTNKTAAGQSAIGMVVQWAYFYFLFARTAPMTWSEGPSISQGIALAVLTLFATIQFVARDQHWRRLLAPGGMQGGRIASAVFNATFIVNLSSMLFCSGLWLALALLFSEHTLGTGVALLLDSSMVIFEMMFAISGALVIRAKFDNDRVGQWGLIGVMVRLLVMASGFWFYKVEFSHLPPARLLYAGILAAASTMNVRLANRLWTPQHLLRRVRAGV